MRYINDNTPKMSYLANIQLQDGTAENVFHGIKNFIEEKGQSGFRKTMHKWGKCKD